MTRRTAGRSLTAAAALATFAVTARAQDAGAVSTGVPPAEVARRLDEIEKSVQLLQDRLGRQTQAPSPANSVVRRLDDLEKQVADLDRALKQAERKLADLERRLKRAEAKP